LLAQPARGDLPDAGAPGDAAMSDAAGAKRRPRRRAGAADTDGAGPPPELAPVPSTTVAQPLIDNPTPAQAEPPRPITRRLWFWMAMTGLVIGVVVAGIAINNPNTTRPECPSGYVCPR
jgi:hypothetical protein